MDGLNKALNWNFYAERYCHTLSQPGKDGEYCIYYHSRGEDDFIAEYVYYSVWTFYPGFWIEFMA